MFAAGRWKCRILAMGSFYQIITVAFYHVTFLTYTNQSMFFILTMWSIFSKQRNFHEESVA